jgi:co-chaperonin GroES (HSP10)
MTYPLNPIHKDVVFQFEEGVSASGTFKEKTDWGFEIKEDATQGGDSHRIVNVIATGPECVNVQAGMKVVVEALMWTNQFDVNGSQYWKTDESKIIAIMDD